MAGVKGIGGQNRKSAALHQLAGTYREDRHQESAIERFRREKTGRDARVLPMRRKRVRVPAKLLEGLAEAGLRFARAVYGDFDDWSEAELALLRRAAEQLDVAASCHHHVITEGLYVTTAKGKTLPHPMLRAGRQATATFAALCRQLGLDREDL